MPVRAFAAAAALLASAASSGANAAPLQPTGKWIVHFDDAQCVAQRDYGPPGEPLYLLLKRPVLGEVVQVSLVDNRLQENAIQIDGRIQFDTRRAIKTNILRFSPANTGTRVQMTNLVLGDFAAAGTARVMRVTVKDFDRELALSDMPELLSVMNNCVADLSKAWNVTGGTDRAAKIREGARGNVQGLITPDDYPDQAFRNADAGSVKVALLINEEGRVADCSVIETSRVAALDAQACAVLKARATFTPAVGTDGKPAKDSFIQTINWKAD
jgi:TonB family protein